MNITEKCTGCMACYNSCPFNAIEIVQNKKGFYEPKIIKEKCKNCKKCVSVCPQNNPISKNKFKEIYAAWSKDKDIRINSTSGGIFSELANIVLNKNGVVIGAMFDQNFKTIHGVITNKKDLDKTRGSKYVQSYIGNSFKIAKEFLDKGKVVLFSGVGCQIAGLKKFLNKEYNNLYTIDVLCHGVPSPRIFEEYKDRQNQKEISNIRFRFKKPSWTIFSMKIDYKNGSSYMKDTYKDLYTRAFLEDYITNDVCCECQYVGEKRVSDITLADFWGYISENYKTRNTEKGISLVMINSLKGNELFENIKKNVVYVRKNIDEAKKGNQCLREPFKKNKNYNDFWKIYFEYGYDKAFQRYIKQKRMPLKRRISLLFNDKAYLIPKNFRNKLIEIREKNK